MLPIVLYAAAGALLFGGVFGSKQILDIANDEAAKSRVLRRIQDERELINEALATEEVREEARRRGVDLKALREEVQESREAQEQMLNLLIAVLGAKGATPESVRRMLEK